MARENFLAMVRDRHMFVDFACTERRVGARKDHGFLFRTNQNHLPQLFRSCGVVGAGRCGNRSSRAPCLKTAAPVTQSCWIGHRGQPGSFEGKQTCGYGPGRRRAKLTARASVWDSTMEGVTPRAESRFVARVGP